MLATVSEEEENIVSVEYNETFPRICLTPSRISGEEKQSRKAVSISHYNLAG